MKNSISNKFAIGFVFCFLLLAAVTGFGFSSMQRLEKLHKQSLKRSVDMELATDTQHIGEDLYQIIGDAVINRDMVRTRQRWDAARKESLLKLRGVAAVSDTPEEHAKVREARQAFDDIGRIFEQEMMPIVRKGTGVPGPLADIDARLYRRIEDIELALQRVAKSMSNENQTAAGEFNAVLADTKRFGPTMAFAGVLLALSFFALMIRRVVRSLSELTGAALEIEKGNYHVDLKRRSDDEIGILADAFGSMAEQVERRTEELRKARDEMEDKVDERTAELSFANDLLRQEFSVREQITEALRKKEARLNEAQRVAHIGSWELDIVNNVLLWSDEEYRIFEIDPKEFGASYEAFLAAIHPEDRLLVDKAYSDSLKNKAPYGISHRLQMPDGRIKFVYERCETFYDRDGNPVRSIGTTQDITEQKLAEESLIKLSHVIEQSPVSIVIADTGGNIEFVNPAVTRATGYEFRELLGQNPKIFKSGETPPEQYKELWQAILAGNVWQGELLYRKKNGELFWEFETITPIKNNEGAITHFAAIKEDVTERKKLEEQLRHSQKLEGIGQLAGGIAHDFNNILNAIIGFGGLLEMELDKDSPLMPHVREILSAGERGSSLTRQILAFSRKQMLDMEPANLTEIILNLDKLFSRLLPEDIELRLELSDGDMIIMADSSQIDQIMINLVTNARDAMPSGGDLTISTGFFEIDEEFVRSHGYGEPGKFALIRVGDTGTGIAYENRKRIFDPFFTTKEVGKGTGLGLAVVYGIVTQHRGYIDAYSEPGLGSEFRIFLPLIESWVKTDKPVAVSPPGRGTETVLVAEDNASLRNYSKTILEKFGYRVILAEDGEDAVNKFAEHKDSIRLLLLDVIMPKKNGKEALDEIKRAAPGIKALFMSGYTADAIGKKGMTEEGMNFISKPISPADLLRKVRQVLDGNA